MTPKHPMSAELAAFRQYLWRNMDRSGHTAEYIAWTSRLMRAGYGARGAYETNPDWGGIGERDGVYAHGRNADCVGAIWAECLRQGV